MESHDLADMRPTIGLGDAVCEYTIIQKHAICTGDEALIWSHTYMDFSLAFGSSFEVLFPLSLVFSSALPRVVSSYLVAP